MKSKIKYKILEGALDGKHIMIKKPPHSGSLFYNYKGHYSTVLLAIADADYRFIMIDFGSFGHRSDAGIWADSKFRENLINGRLNLPEDTNLPNSDISSPFLCWAIQHSLYWKI